MQRLSIDALRSFSGVAPIDLWTRRTALLSIDMQNRLAREDGYTVAMLRARGLEGAASQYLAQMNVAIPNVRALLDRQRSLGFPVVHVRPTRLPNRQGSATKPNIGYTDSADAWEFVTELAPLPGEVVLDKACSGAFAGSNIDYTLRRLGVEGLIAVGCVTDGCVEQAIRYAHDLGYACVLVSDGTAALTEEIHQDALERLEHRRAHVRTAGALLAASGIERTEIRFPA